MYQRRRRIVALVSAAGLLALAQVACIALTGVSDFEVTGAPTDSGAVDSGKLDTGPVDTGPGCDAGLKLCGGKCVDTKNDPANCGACGTACPPDQLCSDSACALTCTTGFTKCPDGKCWDLTKSSTHCGSCSTSCASDQDCVDSSCTPKCTPPKDTRCAGACTDLKYDNDNCGECGKKCDPTTGKGDCCGGGCTDLKTDEMNCGKCGNVCDKGDTCTAGLCTTTFAFPTVSSRLYDARTATTATLGGGGCSLWIAGSYVEQSFPRTTAISHLDVSITMKDCTAGCGSGVYYYFTVKVNCVVVGGYNFKGGAGTAGSIVQSYTFAPISPIGGAFTVRYEATTSVCTSGGAWGWVAPAGKDTMY